MTCHLGKNWPLGFEAVTGWLCGSGLCSKLNSTMKISLFSCRELNSMGIWYRMGRVPRNHDSSQPTTPSQSSAASTPAPNLPR